MVLSTITGDQQQSTIKSVVTGEERAPPPERSLHRIFEQALVDHPDGSTQKGVIFQRNFKSYERVNRDANLLARVILERSRIRLDAQQGKAPLVAVCLEPSGEVPLLFLAIMKAGGAYIPIDPTFPVNRIIHILETSNPALLVYHSQQSASLRQAIATLENNKNFQVPTADYRQLEEWANTCNLADGNLQDDECVKSDLEIVCVMYTSGSTGIPKGVMLGHAQLINRLTWGWNSMPYADDEVFCLKTNTTFADSITEMYGPMLKLQTVVVFPTSTVRCVGALISALKEYQCQRLILVPSVLRSILLRLSTRSNAEVLLPDLGMWICSGERLPKELLDQFFDIFPSGRVLHNLYGSTEVTGDVTYATFTGPGQGLVDGKVPIGVPLDNSTIYLVDDQLQLVPVGEVGEMLVAGLNVNPGYLNEVAQSSNRFLEDPFNGSASLVFRTGDFAKIVDGVITYEGRTDSQLKIRGQRVDLSEVESAMLSLPGIDKAVVLFRPPKGKDETPKLVGFYTVMPDGPVLSFRDVVTHLRACLPSAMMPLPFPIPSIPYLHNGKVDRQLLMSNFESCNVNWESNDSANEEDPVGKVLLDAVGAIVGIKHPHILNLDNNFFDMGGDSLNSVLLLMDLQNSGYNVQIHDLLICPSLRDLVPKMRTPSPINPEPDGLSDSLELSEGQNSDDDLLQPPVKIAGPQLSYESVEMRTLAQVPRDEAISLMADSFAYKGQLECCVGTTPEDYHVFLNDVWQWYIDVGLSFGMFAKEDGKLLAVGVSFDFHNPKEITFPPGVRPVFDFLDDIEIPIRRKFADKSVKVMHGSMMATTNTLTGQENVMMIKMMEEANIRVAIEHGYQYIVSTNTSPLTRDVCRNIIGYKLFSEVYPARYVAADGTRPFEDCSTDLTVEVVYKRIT